MSRDSIVSRIFHEVGGFYSSKGIYINEIACNTKPRLPPLLRASGWFSARHAGVVDKMQYASIIKIHEALYEHQLDNYGKFNLHVTLATNCNGSNICNFY